MSRLEVQYAVRFLLDGGWRVLPHRYTSRTTAEGAAVPGPGRVAGAEVVAQVVMVAGDWMEPDAAEELVREHHDQERRHETMDIDPELFTLRRRSPEDRRAYLAKKRAEWVAAGN